MNDTDASRAPDAAAPEASAELALQLPRDKRKKKRKKKAKRLKYSPGIGLAQAYVRAMNKAGRHLGRSAAVYWKVWDESWDRSARRRSDGALRDIPVNYGRALSASMKAAQRGPRAFTRALPKVRPFSWLRVFVPPLWFVP
jgi:hypothetical protein